MAKDSAQRQAKIKHVNQFKSKLVCVLETPGRWPGKEILEMLMEDDNELSSQDHVTLMLMETLNTQDSSFGFIIK